MKLLPLTPQDKGFWFSLNTHGNPETFFNHIAAQTAYILWEDTVPVGLMHHCILWERLPFLNLLLVTPEHRRKGLGAKAMGLWEQEMKAQGFAMVLTSTQADEEAQHFYRCLGYVDCGGLVFHHTPLDQPLELFLYKVLPLTPLKQTPAATPFQLEDYMMQKPYVTREPQPERNRVCYNVDGVLFAVITLDQNNQPVYITLKVPPEQGEALRSQYEDVIHGLYGSPLHRSSIKIGGSVPEVLLKELVNQSYQFSFKRIPLKRRVELLNR